MDTKQFQVKFRLGDDLHFDPAVILAAGGSHQGNSIHHDTFVEVDGKVWRIRKNSDGSHTVAHKGPNMGSSVREQTVHARIVSADTAAHMAAQGQVKAVICKDRSIYRMPDGTTVCIDKVEQMGELIEVFGSSTEQVEHTLELIGLGRAPRVHETYYGLAMQAPVPRWMRTLMAVHDQVGEFAFGITSGVVTTSGLLLSMAAGMAATSPEAALKAALCAIAGIAVSDSPSDAFGVFMMKSSERGVSLRTAFRAAFRTFVGKLILPLTYLIPIMILPLWVAIPLDLTWGIMCLAILSAEQALVAHEPVLKMVAIKVGFAVIVMAFGTVTGALIGKWG